MVVAVEMGKWSLGMLFPFLPHNHQILGKCTKTLIFLIYIYMYILDNIKK